VPTAPAILPTAISSRAARSLVRPRFASARWPASTTPKLSGSAWMPWLRPIIGVRRCSTARFASAST